MEPKPSYIKYIIILVVFAVAVSLFLFYTSRQKKINNHNIEKAKIEIVQKFAEDLKNAPVVSVRAQEQLIKNMNTGPAPKQLTPEEKAAIIKSLSN